MDCNSYSYTADGFGADHNPPLKKIENDDMSAELCRLNGCIGFSVFAGSYDGSLDVYESFNTLEAAEEFYQFIVDHYSDSPPVKRELNQVIKACKQHDREQTERVIFRTEKCDYAPDGNGYMAIWIDEEANPGYRSFTPFYFDRYGRTIFEASGEVCTDYYYNDTRPVKTDSDLGRKCLREVERFYSQKFRPVMRNVR